MVGFKLSCHELAILIVITIFTNVQSVECCFAHFAAKVNANLLPASINCKYVAIIVKSCRLVVYANRFNIEGLCVQSNGFCVRNSSKVDRSAEFTCWFVQMQEQIVVDWSKVGE